MASAVSENVETWKAKLDKLLHEKNFATETLEKIEKKTGVRRLYVAIGLLAILGLYLMIGYGAQFVCNFVGFLYPAYASIKAIESHNKEDDTKWLTYWVVYAVFSLIEFFADIFLFWIPFYWFLKCCFLGYCMAPMTWNGSHTIYNRVIRPIALKYQDRIDTALDKASDAIHEVFGAGEVAEKMASEAATEAIKKQVVDSSKSD
ncbi:receptor expression-enhancing protein 5-like isoform X2 [Mizuhopecten yessoensis]|uniref:receptor expression-enhancing protein 5-like isoform X2 n=1 Tax=Mizuhopecten yessoensis TaxID=6573 RepID=UPI000B45D831|nr:receptor expression-enhancing protein 5-like isoform X2 [Mizuhopecten yessoensis]